ncbi:oxidoreductase-like protein [Alcaligenaceae bacterium SJ-26]|nr:oxidoreductase-like protein [Alcaligenaceae bacterium SJ-26]
MTETLLADILSDPPPQCPEAPGPNECCQSGCDPCVLDLYAEELQQYREALRQWQARHPEANPEPRS